MAALSCWHGGLWEEGTGSPSLALEPSTSPWPLQRESSALPAPTPPGIVCGEIFQIYIQSHSAWDDRSLWPSYQDKFSQGTRFFLWVNIPQEDRPQATANPSPGEWICFLYGSSFSLWELCWFKPKKLDVQKYPDHWLSNFNLLDTSHWEFLYSFSQVSQLMLVVKNPSANAGDIRDTGSIPDSGRPPGGSHVNPLLENPMERGTWQTSP